MDISKSLRVVADNAERLGMCFSAHEVREAAAEIDTLRARVRELEAVGGERAIDEATAAHALSDCGAEEIAALRRALVEAGRCVECDGYGRICVDVVCIECGGTGSRADLTPETRAVVARAKEALDG